MRGYYPRRYERAMATLEAVINNLADDNELTRFMFEEKFASRFVTVVALEGDPFETFDAVVIGFLPLQLVRVADRYNQILDVPLDRLEVQPSLVGKSSIVLPKRRKKWIKRKRRRQSTPVGGEKT
jgi:hypothetical protein